MLAPTRTIIAIPLSPSVRLEIARKLFNNFQEVFVQARSVAVFSFHGSEVASSLLSAANRAA